MSQINRYLTKIYSFIKPKNHIWLPNTIFPDDTFIVSYPKSGNTWVRFLLANILKKNDETIDFYTVNKYVPEVFNHADIIRNMTRPRLLKSHAPYIPTYPRVIYIVRDGRDVYTSYYFHRLHQLPQGIMFLEFLQRNDHYPCLWGEHVSSWLFRKNLPSQLLVTRYENLKTNCLEELKRMVKFIGIKSTRNQLSLAIEDSSYLRMKQLEQERGRPKSKGPKVFVRKGQIGDWKNYWESKEKKIFKSREGHVLLKLGYEVDNNW